MFATLLKYIHIDMQRGPGACVDHGHQLDEKFTKYEAPYVGKLLFFREIISLRVKK